MNADSGTRVERRTLLLGAGAALLASACGTRDDRTSPTSTQQSTSTTSTTAPPSPSTTSTTTPPSPSTTSTTTPHRAGALAWKGVNYDTGTAYVAGFDSRQTWRHDFVERELAAIHDELGCNAVILYGTFPERLAEAADIATDLGLMTWMSPRLPDAEAAETLTTIVAVAEEAESIRRARPNIGLIVGCELTVFMAGLVPGEDVLTRAGALSTIADGSYNARLGEFLTEAVAAGRSTFDGQVTYSAGTWEVVDWSPFDVVGSNHYRDVHNAATYRDDLRRLFDHNRPVLITEFGCAAYQGAADKGPNGDDIVDWSTVTPTLIGAPIRDEQVQADYIDELLDLFEAEGATGAFVFQFIEPAAPYHPNPTRDLDMAAMSLVRVDRPDSPDSYERTGQWIPKRAFDTLARR